CKLLEINLTASGYCTHSAATGKLGIQLAANHNPDINLLDLDLPDLNGQEVLVQLRDWYKTALVVVSVERGEEAISKALDNGANDFLSKPFRVGELMARLRSAARHNESGESQRFITAGELEVDLAGRVLKKEGELVKLTTTEYRLLALLAQNAGRVLTHR